MRAAGGLLLGLLLGPALALAAGNPLDLDPEHVDFSENPELRERVLESPYGYFRFINLPFAAEVCARFDAELGVLPTVNLHGDAHLEQYAVTDVGYGFSDFDDACSGPAVLDLVRFASSLVLACRIRGYPDGAEAVLRVFFDAYELALAEPGSRTAVPRFVEGILEDFDDSRRPFLDWVQTILEPIEPEEAETLFAGFERYRELVHARNPRLRAEFFDVQSAGRIRIGVGSALDRKYLLRVAGPTGGPDDDVVLEIREVRDLSGIPCIRAGEGRGAFRILLGFSRIGNVPADFIAPLPRGEGDPLDDSEFWVHSWQAHYREIDVETDGFSFEELLEVVRDAGLKLAAGHTAEIADPHRFALRRMQATALSRFRARLIEVSFDMADLTVDAWERHLRNSGPR